MAAGKISDLDIIERLFYNKIEVTNMDIQKYWQAVLEQDREALADFFREDAWVNWHNTNEHFTVSEFIRANCDYPGQWDGEVERIVELEDQIITAVHVYPKDRSLSFHVVSFLRVRDGKIRSIDEYWGDDGQPPKWRQDLHIGRPIR